MKKLHLILFLCFYCLNSNGQSDPLINIGKVDSIYSEILNEQRKVWVYVPNSDDNDIYLKTSYPVIYILDGDAHFLSVISLLQHLSANQICPQMIVVGIPNTNRDRDLTPTKPEFDHPFLDSVTVANSGGGDKFISFLENELIPKIDAEYPTKPYRMFIGHSLGGLEVVHTLINKPDVFNSYVAIDPSMWWDNQKLLKEIKETTIGAKYKNKTLFLGIANTMAEGMDILSVQKDTTVDTEHIRSILQLNDYLNKDSHNQLAYKGKYYEEDTHNSVTLMAEYDALRFIFDFYQLKLEMQDYMNPESDVLSKVSNHHIKLSEVFGYDIKPDEDFVNSLGYNFLRMKQFKKSEQFFKLNVSNYPESFNVYDSIGDFYAANGEKEKAIQNYKKAIALNKDSIPSIEKLEALEKE
jgi:predicted alpha/beta superfamily hydrolase